MISVKVSFDAKRIRDAEELGRKDLYAHNGIDVFQKYDEVRQKDGGMKVTQDRE